MTSTARIYSRRTQGRVQCGRCDWIPQPGTPGDEIFRVRVHLERVHNVITGVYASPLGLWGPLCTNCEEHAHIRLVICADDAYDPWRCAGCGAWLPPPGGAQ